jgi:hypothetical protein
VPAGSLTGVAGVLGFVALIEGAVFGLLQASTPYRQARAQRGHVVISASWLLSGSLNSSGGTGRAGLAIPLQSTRDLGALFVEARLGVRH